MLPRGHAHSQIKVFLDGHTGRILHADDLEKRPKKRGGLKPTVRHRPFSEVVFCYVILACLWSEQPKVWEGCAKIAHDTQPHLENEALAQLFF